MPRHKHYIYNPETPGADFAAKGQKGSTGIRGTNGQKGERGQKGSAGLDGHTTTIVGSFNTASPSTLPKSGTLPVGWDGGTNPPIPFSLEVGESLIDTRTGDLWCFTPGSNIYNWTNVGRISGPRGTNGADGARGAKGEVGEKGSAGLDGPQGETGKRGFSGAAGAKGQKGEVGLRGPAGLNGNNGGQGIKGIKGSKGEAGLNGKDGFLGGDGPEGPKGQKGEVGSPGPRGVQGLPGKAGKPAPTHLLPRVGGSINVANAGLHDKFNISKAEKLETGKLRVYFSTPLTDTHYTVMMTTQSGRPEEVLSSFVIERATNYVDIAVKTNATDDYCNYGIISLVIFRFLP